MCIVVDRRWRPSVDPSAPSKILPEPLTLTDSTSEVDVDSRPTHPIMMTLHTVSGHGVLTERAAGG